MVFRQVSVCPKCDGRGHFIGDPCPKFAGRGEVERVGIVSADNRAPTASIVVRILLKSSLRLPESRWKAGLVRPMRQEEPFLNHLGQRAVIQISS
jgi:hypothetical protein